MSLRRIGFAMATTLIATSAATAVLAQNTPAPAAVAPKPPACVAPENRQFDFWLGEWEVRDVADKLLGQNRITSLHKGCVLFENYRAGEFTGSSLNVYDADKGKWHQTWVDSGGGLLVIEGGLVDGKMILAGETVDPGKPGGKADNRITWQPLADGRVRQLWETSTDKGRTWTTTFDGYYAKQK
jgi:hypothetical protein